jgi:hypothetical protein
MTDDATDQLAQQCPKSEDDEKVAFLGKTTDDSIGIMANYFQVLGIPGLSAVVVALLDAYKKYEEDPSGPSAVSILQLLQEQMTDLVNESGALESEIKMLSLATQEIPVSSDLEILAVEGERGPHVTPGEFFQRSLDLVNEFLFSDIYWYRPLILGVVFTPAYIGGTVGYAFWNWSRPELLEAHPPYRLIPPSNTDRIPPYKTVFDPRLALPAYMNAIGLFLGINMLLNPAGFGQFVSSWKDKISEFADFLQDIYDGSISQARGSQRSDTLIGGLVKSAVPSMDEVFDYIMVNATPGARHGYQWNGLYGVVNVYGGFANPVGAPSRSVSHFLDMFSTDKIGQLQGMMRNDYTYIESIYPWVKNRVTLGIMARWKTIYRLQGYDKAWSVVQALRIITGAQSYKLNDANKNWSARELISALDLPTIGTPQFSEDYSLSDLVERLDQIAKGTWDKTPDPWLVTRSKRPEDGLTYDPSGRPVGFRDRLAAAAV